MRPQDDDNLEVEVQILIAESETFLSLMWNLADPQVKEEFMKNYGKKGERND